MCAQPDYDAIRRPAVAGQFYPDSATALCAAIEEAFLSPLGPGALPQAGEGASPLGIIVPHAGYLYSAQGAAWGYAEVARGDRPEAVVLLGVNHRGSGAPIALSPARAWQTPLGEMPVAAELAARLQALDGDVRPDARAHALEHSLEVHVPFLQYIFGEIPLLPLAIGAAPVPAVFALGEALGMLARETKLLFVGSTDFSHYLSQRQAEAQDRLALERIAAVDAAGLVNTVREYGITMCGVLPVAALLTAARGLGITHARVLHYHTSGDVIGDRRQVVGYGTAVLYRPE